MEQFLGKMYNFENFPQSENLSKIGGKSETEEKMHHGLRGMDDPAYCEE